jgi:hypothetical protein
MMVVKLIGKISKGNEGIGLGGGLPIRAVITRRWCNAKDNVQDASKLVVICKLQTLVNNVPYNVWLSVITLIRTDTTLDLSQKAEKSMFLSKALSRVCEQPQPKSEFLLFLVGVAVCVASPLWWCVGGFFFVAKSFVWRN